MALRMYGSLKNERFALIDRPRTARVLLASARDFEDPSDRVSKSRPPVDGDNNRSISSGLARSQPPSPIGQARRACEDERVGSIYQLV